MEVFLVPCSGELHRVLLVNERWSFPDHRRKHDLACEMFGLRSGCDTVKRIITAQTMVWFADVSDFPKRLVQLLETYSIQALEKQLARSRAKWMPEDRYQLLLWHNARRRGLPGRALRYIEENVPRPPGELLKAWKLLGNSLVGRDGAVLLTVNWGQALLWHKGDALWLDLDELRRWRRCTRS